MPQFVFIVGVSGSGTTLLTRIAGAASGAVALGGNHVSIPESDRDARRLADRFNEATQTLWDREADRAAARAARTAALEALAALTRLPGYRQLTHVIYKRSAPFLVGDRYRPRLIDVVEMFEGARIVAIFRDPRASAASSYRREFGRNLRHCAIITEEQLTLLSAQLAILDPASVLRVPYEEFCVEPEPWSRRLAAFCGLPGDDLAAAARREGVDPTRNDVWRRRLEPDQAAFLDEFFGPRRARQWPLLAADAQVRS